MHSSCQALASESSVIDIQSDSTKERIILEETDRQHNLFECAPEITSGDQISCSSLEILPPEKQDNLIEEVNTCSVNVDKEVCLIRIFTKIQNTL